MIRHAREHSAASEVGATAAFAARGSAVVSGMPAHRFRVAQSWWIAAEIARRNPHLFVWEHHPGGGQYDCLALADERAFAAGPLIDLNRDGSLQVHRPVSRTISTWADVLAADNPHDVVKALEVSAELRPSGGPTTPRTLVYRVIARVLAGLVDDKHRWDARSDAEDRSDDKGGPRGFLDLFPSAQAAAARAPRLGWWLEPQSHFWALTRDDEPVVLLDVRGRLHTRSGSAVDLMESYRANGAHLGRTVARSMSPHLP